MEAIIGREKELSLLEKYYKNDKEEFIAIYGRRRVGKTFLVRHFCKDQFDFYVTGIIGGTKAEEMAVFNDALKEYGYRGTAVTTWREAFAALGELLEEKANKKERLVVFIDELPCFDTHRSGFVKVLDHFWNSKGAWISNLFFIVCGSATSWMIRNLIDNKGGLHNRITHEFHISPFSLRVTEMYLQSKGANWDRLSIAQIYMALGGIPYYLSLLDFDTRVVENIDNLFFSKNAELRKEYKRLVKSLYKNANSYMKVIDLLASHKSGMTRCEIAKSSKVESGGFLSEILEDLVNCDFVLAFNSGKASGKTIYRLIDFYTLFYHHFCKRRSSDIHFWRNNLRSPMVNTWYGLAFERLCMYHIEEVKQALRLDSIYTEYYGWRGKAGNNAQIDLVIDRADNVATICEIKYSNAVYTLTKEEHGKIINRSEAFARENPTKGTQVVMITTFGVNEHSYPDIMRRGVVLDNLFEKLIDD